MALFQKPILIRHLNTIDNKNLLSAYKKFIHTFGNPIKQQNILKSKEEQYQEGFLRDLFVDVFGYILNPNEHYNLITEKKNQKGAKKADAAILSDNVAICVIELKSTKTVDLDSIEEQAFGYKNNQKGCRYVITCNFKKLRFYIENTVEFEEFDLFNLSIETFKLLWLCINKDSLLNDLPYKLRLASNSEEEKITKKLYIDYADFRKSLYNSIISLNGDFNQILLFNKTQKLLDRFLFLFFAEDRGLVPANWTRKILKDWDNLKEHFDIHIPLYNRFKINFEYLNVGFKNNEFEIFAYNGGLFATDELLDKLKIDDGLLYQGALKLSNYDFDSEVDVNILGHIFEHSLNEIENLKLLVDKDASELSITKRKKDGVFYTPKYITKYIVENTIGTLCKEKWDSLNLNLVDFVFIPRTAGKRLLQTRETSNNLLNTYREWLLNLKIIDPACGSGAFLNEALDFLISEHRRIDELKAILLGGSIILSDVENSILERNLYGVDINNEAVEIARLSLWLRTARNGRKLSSLNKNIKCGNSLIDDPFVSEDKAFNWKEEFSEVFDNNGFDIVIGNPPYGIFIDAKQQQYFNLNFPLTRYKINLYVLFIEQMFKIFDHRTVISFIIPKSLLINSFYDQIRKQLIENAYIREIFTISEKVFPDAEVGGSLILTFEVNYQSEKKTKYISVNSFFDSSNEWKITYVQQNEYLKVPKYEISYVDTTLIDLKDKFHRNSKLEDYFDTKNGLNPGNVKHLLVSTIKENSNFSKIIWGKDLVKYNISWSGDFINYDNTLKFSVDQIKSKAGMNSQLKVDYALRSKDIFLTNKVLVRKTGDKLITALDTSNYFFDTLVHGIYAKSSDVNSLKALSCLLNSNIATSIYRLLHDIKGKVFAKISLDNLQQFPIPSLTQILKSDLNDFYDQQHANLKEIEIFKKQTSGFVYGKLNISNDSKFKGLENYDYSAFLNDLLSFKIKLKLSEQQEWFEYFTELKSKMETLGNAVILLSQQIENEVASLYNLTSTEIESLLNL